MVIIPYHWDVDGFFAEYAVIPETNVWKNTPNMPFEIATLLESIGNSVYTVFSNDVTCIISVAGSGLHLDITQKMSGLACHKPGDYSFFSRNSNIISSSCFLFEYGFAVTYPVVFPSTIADALAPSSYRHSTGF